MSSSIISTNIPDLPSTIRPPILDHDHTLDSFSPIRTKIAPSPSQNKSFLFKDIHPLQRKDVGKFLLSPNQNSKTTIPCDFYPCSDSNAWADFYPCDFRIGSQMRTLKETRKPNDCSKGPKRIFVPPSSSVAEPTLDLDGPPPARQNPLPEKNNPHQTTADHPCP